VQNIKRTLYVNHTKHNAGLQSHKRGHKTRLLQSSKPCCTKSLDTLLGKLWRDGSLLIAKQASSVKWNILQALYLWFLFCKRITHSFKFI